MVRVVPAKAHGLETWRIYYAGTLVGEFMSREYAVLKARQLIYKLFQGVK
jgi:hypothetical protein